MKHHKFNILTIISLIFLLTTAFYPTLAFGEKDKGNQDLPEVEGIYDVPGHPKLKLRVFVYRAKPASSPAPTLQCDLPDPDSSAMDAWAGWKLPFGTSYYLNSASVPSTVGSTNLRKIASSSFDVWNQASGKKFTLNNAGETSASRAAFDSKNIIAWGRAPGSALGITYIWYYPSSGRVAEVDTIMNKKFTWYWSDPTSWDTNTTGNTCAYQGVYDAQDILTHELGHWFGLNDHYTTDYTNNTMYGYGAKTETKKDTLTAGDVAGIVAIYQ